MTRFFLDEREITPPSDIFSLNQILKHVESVHLSPNTVVRQIWIDGSPFSIPTADGVADFSLEVSQREKIEIFTGTVTEIARESIQDALQYLNRVETATPSLISSFQDSPGPETFEGIKQLYQGLYWLIVLLSKLKANFQIDFESTVIQGTLVSEHHNKFISVLKQLIASQEKRDFVLTADLLEYEILPLVPIWRKMFCIFLDKINALQ